MCGVGPDRAHSSRAETTDHTRTRRACSLQVPVLLSSRSALEGHLQPCGVALQASLPTGQPGDKGDKAASSASDPLLATMEAPDWALDERAYWLLLSISVKALSTASTWGITENHASKLAPQYDFNR